MVFPTFFNLSEFDNKEFMIWATVSSQSCFCWLYRASPFLAAKNIINLISVLTIWWCPCVESSLVLLKESVCYDQCVRTLWRRYLDKIMKPGFLRVIKKYRETIKAGRWDATWHLGNMNRLVWTSKCHRYAVCDDCCGYLLCLFLNSPTKVDVP